MELGCMDDLMFPYLLCGLSYSYWVRYTRIPSQCMARKLENVCESL